TGNLTSIGGPASQKVIDDVVQEVDIRTGKVLFQWNTADHVPFSASTFPLPDAAATPCDWFHINAVHLDADGNLLINSRYTWTPDKVSRSTGKIMWELGGKHSTFRLRAGRGQTRDASGKIFAYQHDPEAMGDGVYTLFDDEADEAAARMSYSRAVIVRLDLATRVATLIRADNHPDGYLARAQGNAQITTDGDLFRGWGVLPYVSEFSPAGRLLYYARLPDGVSPSRAYRLPGHPASRS